MSISAKARNNQMPTTYAPPLGGPLNWADEQTGELKGAVIAYYSTIAPYFSDQGEHRPITEDQIDLVGQYLRYYIDAPIWERNPHATEHTKKVLEQLRETAKDLKTVKDISHWLARAADLGLDPL
jgi:hypothetical protein